MTAPRNLRARPDRIAADIDALAAITEPGRPYTRRSFTPLYLEGRAFLEARMRAAGLDTFVDAAGNLVGRRPGRRPELGVLLVGSHSDTVPDGGRFDGIAGVVAGLEVARLLDERGVTLDHDLHIIDCLAEEVSVFGLSCIGSRLLTGALDRTMADSLSTMAGPGRSELFLGAEIDKVCNQFGAPVHRPNWTFAAFLELHIEQGPVLEAAGLDLGIVTGIAGITRVALEVTGRADHAGTTPMDLRSDALVAAADLVLGIRKSAADARSAGEHFVATAGELTIAPNAANVVPAAARLLVDARCSRRGDMDAFLAGLEALCRQVAADRSVAIAPLKLVVDNPPTLSDPALLDELESAAESCGARHRRMFSGAGHDMAWFARVAPAAMVFVPCRGGRSHAPEEWADSGAIALGTEVLFQTLLRLDRRLIPE